MSTPRLVNLKKKNQPVLTKCVYLYYTSDCEFCKELIRILVIVPDLAKIIQCIDINNYQVDIKIDAIPTIDICIKGQDKSVLYKLEDAFTWVMHQCYELLDEQKIKPDQVAKVESRIKNIFRKFQVQKNVKDNDMIRENTDSIPKFKSITEDGNEMAHYDYSGKNKTKELYRYLFQIIIIIENIWRKITPNLVLEERFPIE